MRGLAPARKRKGSLEAASLVSGHQVSFDSKSYKDGSTSKPHYCRDRIDHLMAPLLFRTIV